MPVPDFDATVRSLYLAATGAALWDGALAALRDGLGAAALEVQQAPASATAGRMADPDPRWAHGPAAGTPGHIARLQLRPQAGAAVALQISWSGHQAPDTTTRTWLDRLAPHLNDALRADARLRQLPARAQLGQLLLDTLPHPAWLLRGDGCIAGANAAARQPRVPPRWLQSAGPALLLPTPAEQQAVDAARLQALASDARRPVMATLAGVDASSGAGAQAARARWLIRRLDATADDPVLLAILFDPDAGSASKSGAGTTTLSAPALAGTFGFTPAESRVAVWLAQGCTVREIAILLDVAPSTVRSHLDAVMAKLGVDRKLDAVRLLVQGGWMWRDMQAEGAVDA